MHIRVRARSFLHNQVRSFVGTLERVGSGAWAPDDVTTRWRRATAPPAARSARPQGLYLAGVGYPDDPFV